MAPAIELRLKNKGIAPEQLRAKELAAVITALEDAIAAYVVHQEDALPKDAIRISLTGIRDQSVDLDFVPNLVEYTLPAYRAIAGAFADETFEALPSTTLPPLRDLVRFSKSHDCAIEFWDRSTGDDLQLATITAEVVIPVLPPLRGETTLYGTIRRVGGAEPKIEFRTIQGETLYCPTTEEIAKAAGRLLYEEVALRGVAQWDGETLEVDEFRVEEILDYRRTDPREAFRKLAELVDESYLDVESELHFLRELREGEAEIWS